MYKVGVVPGKFLPPHRGHLHTIVEASTRCEKLYVVVGQSADSDELCRKSGIEPLSLNLRAKWLSAELSDLQHIKVIAQDETHIDNYPNGWEEWAHLLAKTVPEHIDVVFGGEPEYEIGYTKYFPEAKYELIDCDRSRYPISGTEIRNNPLKHWDYILGEARSHFCKKVLIIGTESCGKTTLTKMLAKLYHTSWAREEGRYYSTKYFGGNESLFEPEDFIHICEEQKEVENKAFRTANRISFCDTDATITQYYCKMYTGEQKKEIELFIDPKRYDLVIMMKPDVKWVADGFRFKSEQEERERLHKYLKSMYEDRGFKNIIEVGGNYNERLNTIIKIVDKMIK